MTRLLAAGFQAFLVEGEEIDAEGWMIEDAKVRLVGLDSDVVAEGPLGPFGAVRLRDLEAIVVFAVSPAGVRQVRTLPRVR